MRKHLAFYPTAALILAAVITTLSGCSLKEDSEILMKFQGTDTGKNADIGIYGTATFADLITVSKVCAIDPNDADMQDEHIDASAALRIDVSTNQLVYAQNIYDRVYPASTTKLMTALILLKYGNLKDTYTFKKDNGGIETVGAKLCGFQKGDTISLEALFNCLLIYSGNDAAIAIAEYLCGTEEAFVERMNEEAKKLGATDTHFVNSHGLHDPNHYTTAYDMYLIFRECIQYDSFRQVIRRSSYSASYINEAGETKQTKNYETTNYFLLGTEKAPTQITVIGGKTGSTSWAQTCLVLLSEDSDHHQIITAVFHVPYWHSLFEQHSYLLELTPPSIYE